MIDLHTHSTVSDGSDTPEEVVALAVKAGLSALALTDHDRQDGIAAARKKAAETGIELVAGAEISCNHSGTMHMLVYFLEPGEGPSKMSCCAFRLPGTTATTSSSPAWRTSGSP